MESSDTKYKIIGTRLIVKETDVNSCGEKIIGSYRFCHLDESITEIEIPEGVVSIGFSSFQRYLNLRRIIIPESLKKIKAWTFDKCPLLDTPIINNGRLLFVPNQIEGVFNISEEVTEITEDAFTGCWSLKGVTVPNTVTTLPGGCFSVCKSLETIELPCSIKEIGDRAFNQCEKLKEIQLPAGIRRIGDETFYLCKSLTRIAIPESVESIGEEAFSGTGLEEIFIPDSVRSIGDNAFSNCKKLRFVRLPEGVNIGTNAFYGCDSWADAPVIKARLLNSLQVGDITINQYESWCSEEYRVYLLADIIDQIPETLHPLFGTELSIVSAQGDFDRMLVARGLEDNKETTNFNMRLWNGRDFGRNGIEIEWTCFYEDEIITKGNMKGPRVLGNGITRLSCTKKDGWKIVTPASKRGKTPGPAQLMGEIAEKMSQELGKLEAQASIK